MSYHYHQQLGVREIDSDTYDAWVAAGNPKAQAYAPIPDPPDQYATFDGTEWAHPPGLSPAERLEAYLDQLECTKVQGKLALIQADLWDQYEAIIEAALPNMTPAQQVFLLDTQTWKYRDPVLQMLAAMIQVPESMKLTPEQTSLTDEQLIALIEGAKSL